MMFIHNTKDDDTQCAVTRLQKIVLSNRERRSAECQAAKNTFYRPNCIPADDNKAREYRGEHVFRFL